MLSIVRNNSVKQIQASFRKTIDVIAGEIARENFYLVSKNPYKKLLSYLFEGLAVTEIATGQTGILILYVLDSQTGTHERLNADSLKKLNFNNTIRGIIFFKRTKEEFEQAIKEKVKSNRIVDNTNEYLHSTSLAKQEMIVRGLLNNSPFITKKDEYL